MSEPRSWYAIRDSAKGVADVYLYDEIGFWGITANAFVRDLKAIKAERINLYVNSPGGDVADGTAIYNALDRHPATIAATVDGIAASAASFIVQAADEISMATGATMMVHDPWGMSIGDSANMLKMAAELDVFGDSIADIYAKRAGGTREEWRDVMKAETWYDAQAAVDAKLADNLVPSTKAANLAVGRIFNLSKFRNVPDWVPTAPETPEIDPAEPEKPSAPRECTRWPLLLHHTDSGALDAGRLAIALRRAYDLKIPINARQDAIWHLQSHERVA